MLKTIIVTTKTVWFRHEKMFRRFLNTINCDNFMIATISGENLNKPINYIYCFDMHALL